MKDSGLKDALFRHYWAQGCFVQPEVNVYYSGGVLADGKLITDIDIFAFRPTADLRFQRLLGDCKTLKSQSPVSRALWLSGLMKFCGADSGYVLLSIPEIEPDHKLAALEVDVLLLNDQDFGVYDRSLLGPGGSEDATVCLNDIRAIGLITKRFSRLEPLVKYIHHTALHEKHFGDCIRHTIGQLRAARGEFDPAHREHAALLCDACAVLSIGIAECAGRVFHQYLHPQQKEILSESLKILLWGGKEPYNFYQLVRQRVIEAKGASDANQTSLELPEWNSFVQLIRNILDQPAAFFTVPWLLRQMAVDVLNDTPLFSTALPSDRIALKYAMLVISYVCKATEVPKEFESGLVGPLVKMQSDLAMER